MSFSLHAINFIFATVSLLQQTGHGMSNSIMFIPYYFTSNTSIRLLSWYSTGLLGGYRKPRWTDLSSQREGGAVFTANKTNVSACTSDQSVIVRFWNVGSLTATRDVFHPAFQAPGMLGGSRQ